MLTKTDAWRQTVRGTGVFDLSRGTNGDVMFVKTNKRIQATIRQTFRAICVTTWG
ncbi:hypothetical protein J6590_083526 [Homalodisca vitripennis]|nr:hypothetical protein J6590_083526 [Homalodisca vitripennis]